MIEIVVPGVPDKRANPNTRNSERTRKRYRKAWADQAVIPARMARMAQEARFPISGPVTIDLLIRWPKGRHAWDDDNVIAAAKALRDVLETEGLIVSDRNARIGTVTQERATGQEETVMTITEVAA